MKRQFKALLKPQMNPNSNTIIALSIQKSIAAKKITNRVKVTKTALTFNQTMVHLTFDHS